MSKIKAFLSKRKLNILCTLVSVAIMIAVWITAYYAVRNDYIVPSFSETLKAFFLCFADSAFWVALFNSFLRTLCAFLISFLLAALCAFASVSCRPFKLILNPVMVVFRTLPTLAVVLLILVWSNAKVAPVVVTFLVLFPMIYSQLLTSAEGIDKNLIDMAEVYNISKMNRIFKIYLPLISPDVFSQLGANFSLGLKVMISSEVLAHTYKSLGGLMQDSKAILDMPKLGALTIAAVVLGLILDIALSQLSRINGRWNKTAENK